MRHLLQQKFVLTHPYCTYLYTLYIAMRAVDDVRQSKCNLIFTYIGDKKNYIIPPVWFHLNIYTFYHAKNDNKIVFDTAERIKLHNSNRCKQCDQK